MMLSNVSILIKAPRDDLSEHEVMGGGNEKGLQEASQTMPGCVQGLRGQLVPMHSHLQTMQPDSYMEGPGTVQDPHVPGTLKGDIGHVCLYGRQQVSLPPGVPGSWSERLWHGL